MAGSDNPFPLSEMMTQGFEQTRVLMAPKSDRISNNGEGSDMSLKHMNALSGVKRTSLPHRKMSAYDPKRTSKRCRHLRPGNRSCCCLNGANRECSVQVRL